MYAANYLAPESRSALLEGEYSASGARFSHFLVVDDVSSMRRVISSLLREELGRIRISEAPDGEAALQELAAAEKDGRPIDFVVTDCNMPRMDGVTLLRHIRSNPELQHLPVLLVTAEATKEVILAAAQAGADGYIVKPFNTATLKTKLEQIAARRLRHH